VQPDTNWTRWRIAMNGSLVERIDHLVFASPDLEASRAELEFRLGVRATDGGQHMGRGTRNALIAMGPSSYLELIGPDREQPAPPAPRWFGIDRLTHTRLVAWAVKSDDVGRVISEAAKAGVPMGALASGSRTRADGAVLQWRFTDPTTVVADGLMPFFIDWNAGPHPAETAAGGAAFVGLRGEHPRPEQIRVMLESMEIDLPLQYGKEPMLIATIRTARGSIELS